MKFIDHFDVFLREEVNLNQTRIDRLAQSVGAIEKVLSSHDTFKKVYIDLIPAGSWAHGSIIRPVRESDEFDADVLLSIKEYNAWKPKDYLEKLCSVLSSNDRYMDKVEPMTRCIRVNYNCDFHIDVVPYFERYGIHYITNRREPNRLGGLEESDPETFTAWIQERQHLTNENFIKVVRLVKYLRDFKDTFQCKSIILMTLLGNQVDEAEARYHPELYADIPSTLVTLMSKLANTLPTDMPDVMDPACTGENFTERYRKKWNYSNFRECIINYAQRMRSAYEKENREISVKEWRSIFGEKFKPDTLAKKVQSYLLRESASSEQFIDQHPYNFTVRIDRRFRTRIIARVTGLATDGDVQYTSFRQFELPTRGNLVSKNRSLQFAVTTNVPKPYTVYWKVRNSGAEAERVRQLRGEIQEDEGSNRKTETTAYTGRHYVECYIVKNDTVIAWDRQNVTVINNT